MKARDAPASGSGQLAAKRGLDCVPPLPHLHWDWARAPPVHRTIRAYERTCVRTYSYNTHTHTRARTHMHTCIHASIHTYTHIGVCVCVCVCVPVCACVCVRVCALSSLMRAHHHQLRSVPIECPRFSTPLPSRTPKAPVWLPWVPPERTRASQGAGAH